MLETILQKETKQYKPIFDRVLVEELPELETDRKIGGIILPDQSIDIKKGVVVAKGDKCEAVQVGDTVIFPKGSGVEIRPQDKEYRLFREPELLMIL